MKKKKKNNFTQIPNKILEALAKTKLSNYQFRYICFLLRKTYGFHKTKDYISNSQFVEGTSIRKQNINRVQKQLIERKIVIKRDYKLRINKNLAEWKKSNPKRLPVISGDNRVISGASKVISGEAYKIKDQNKRPKEIQPLSSKELVELYKKGDRRYKPFYRGNPMRYYKDQNRWEVSENGEWLEFADSEGKIEFKNKNV